MIKIITGFWKEKLGIMDPNEVQDFRKGKGEIGRECKQGRSNIMERKEIEMHRNNSNTGGGVEKVGGGQAQDFGRVFGFGVLGVLILALLVAFPIGTTYAQGAGATLDFDGMDEYVQVPTSASLRNVTDVTIEAWIYPESAPYSLGIAGNMGNSKYEGGYFIITYYSGVQFGFRKQTSGWITRVGTGGLVTNRWQHVAGTYDANTDTMKIYLNGVLGNSATDTSSINTSHSMPFYIGHAPGAHGSGTSVFNGKIDEIRVWSVALSETQIQDNMHKTDISSSNLKGYWKLNDGAGSSTAADISGNGNNGTLTNMEPDTDWVTSAAPIASSTTIDKTDLTAVWVSDNSNTSSVMTVTDGDISGTDCIIFGHDNGALSANTADVPGGINRRLNRVWRMEVYGILSGNIIFDCTNLGIVDGNDLRLLEDADGTFSNATIVTGSYSAPNFTVSGHTFQNGYYYTLASTSLDNSLPVELSTFTATSEGGAVTLFWRTESEVENLGFNLYRALEEEGQYNKINPELIQGAGSSASAHDYSFTDTRLTNGVTYWYKLEDVDLDGTKTMHGPIAATPYAVGEEFVALPGEYGLSQSYPNPFNPGTVIQYRLPEDGHVSLKVYDALGHLVKTLVDRNEQAGYKSVWWDGRDDVGGVLGSGVYFCRMDVGGRFVGVRKMVIIR